MVNFEDGFEMDLILLRRRSFLFCAILLERWRLDGEWWRVESGGEWRVERR